MDQSVLRLPCATMMRPAALLCVLSLLEAVAGSYVMTNSNIRTAVDAWLANATAAEATYGHISTWETGGVTDMSYLFCASSGTSWAGLGCNTAAASFNEDIGAWDTSGVTTMNGMFYYASAFDQDLSGWAVQSVTTMYQMFNSASAFDQDLGNWAVESVTSMYKMFNGALAFDQDLGWCVDDGVKMGDAFYGTLCASTSCGVTRKNEFDECEAIGDDDYYKIDFDFDDDDDDDDDDFDDDDDGLGALFGNHAASTRSAALAALVLGAALA